MLNAKLISREAVGKEAADLIHIVPTGSRWHGSLGHGFSSSARGSGGSFGQGGDEVGRGRMGHKHTFLRDTRESSVHTFYLHLLYSSMLRTIGIVPSLRWELSGVAQGAHVTDLEPTYTNAKLHKLLLGAPDPCPLSIGNPMARFLGASSPGPRQGPRNADRPGVSQSNGRPDP